MSPQSAGVETQEERRSGPSRYGGKGQTGNAGSQMTMGSSTRPGEVGGSSWEGCLEEWVELVSYESVPLVMDRYHTDKGESMKKEKKFKKLDCHYILGLERNSENSACCQRSSVSPTDELCDLTQLMAQCLSSLICRKGTIIVPATLACFKE